ncbi:hypothetical protein GCM10009854_14450 [Saccharopolyspora halophila]|uniref:Sigma-70 family RNA polymerase sigma factor n=1 Tax=Saccharopolyspora halophila TaxID=405551 RepID=A0ABN3FX09_9PSEU
MATVSTDVQGPSDGELLEEVRSGSSRAYAQLYERHVASAYNMARQVAKSPAEADDLVSEAFAKVLDTLRDGRGPTSAFRAYLLTSLRHAAYDRTRRDRKVQLADDVAEVSGADVSVPFHDTATAGLERTLAAQAFARLPERWQTVLWHIEVEGQSPAEVAPLLGLTSNGVSALAYRAREGLRQAYLQVHLGQLDASDADVQHCRAAADRLGAWTRGGLSKRETAQVETHLDSCDRCRALAAELADVNGALRVVIAPLVLGGSVAGYLATTASGGTAAGAAVSAGGAGAAGGAAAGDAASSGPRQAVTAGAATAVLAAAVAIAMTSGGGQSIPAAQSPPEPRPPVVPAPPPPVPQPPAPQPPAAPPPAPQPPAAPPPAPQPPAPQPPPAQAPPPAPAPAPAPPAPGAPSLSASGPSQPLRLIAGGDPLAVPITLANNGTADSQPITSTMRTPEGVSARMPNAASSGPATTAPQSVSAQVTPVRAQAPGAPNVTCSNQGDLLTCTTDRGLRPGESMAFDYLVQAGREATDGTIDVSISAGTQIDLSLPAVHVIVEDPPPPPPPNPIDGVDLTATAQHAPWLPLPHRVTMTVANTGTSTRRAQARAELPDGAELHLPSLGQDCAADRGETAVTCSKELRPNSSATWELWVAHDGSRPWWPMSVQNGEHYGRDLVVPITATLGKATDHQVVQLDPWWPDLPPGPECPPWWTPPHWWKPGPNGEGDRKHVQHGDEHWDVWRDWDSWHCVRSDLDENPARPYRLPAHPPAPPEQTGSSSSPDPTPSPIPSEPVPSTTQPRPSTTQPRPTTSSPPAPTTSSEPSGSSPSPEPSTTSPPSSTSAPSTTSDTQSPTSSSTRPGS